MPDERATVSFTGYVRLDGLEDSIPGETSISTEIGMTLLEVIRKKNLFIPSNCGGKCACGTCHVHVREGQEYLSEMDDREQDTLDEVSVDTDLDSRLACCCRIISAGRIIVEIPKFHGISHSD